MPKPDKKPAIAAVSPEQIAPLVECFLIAIGDECSPTRLGKEATNNPNQVFLIRGGREIRQNARRKIVAVIERYRPGFTQAFFDALARGEFPETKKRRARS